jgi:hypothetical protein
MLGMHHLEPYGPRAHFAVATYALTARECLLLRTIEVEEPQRDRARAVREPAQQRTATAHGHLGELDAAFDQHLVADPEAADGAQCRTILVPLRHEAQEIADGEHAELGQPLGDLRAYARETLDRSIEERCGQRSDA